MDRLDELRLVLAVMEAGSLAAAGRRLGLAPPAMTRALAALEARLGVRLAERSTRRLMPTEAGRRLAEHARRLLSDYAEAMEEAAGEAAAPRGRLRIAAPLVFGRRHVAPVVQAFLDTAPQVQAELVLSDRFAELVEEGIDCAIRIGALADSSLVGRRLGTLRRVVAASPAYLARHGTPLHPQALEGHEAVLFGNRAWRFQDGGRPFTVQPQPRLQVNEAEAAVAAAVAGRGIVAALSYQVAAELADGRLVRLLRQHELPPLPVHCVFLGGRLMPARLRAFLDFATPLLRALPVLQPEAPA